MTHSLRTLFALSLFAAAMAMTASPARADDPPPPSSWASSIKLSAQVQGGFTLNPATPKINFGQLFNDKPNTVLLNQLLLTAARTIDPKQTGWDVGFKVQFLYGSDARYTHFLGVLNYVTQDRNQLDFTEANVTIHAPILTEGGVDLKLGLYPTPIGYETIDPATNPFYSHSYIFNFGVPLKHTGGLAVVHATPAVDVYLGFDTGVNTTFGIGGDNNGAQAGIVGFGLNLMDGNLTVLALSHIGPENPTKTVPNADSFMRYLNDVVVTWKASDKLTLVTELNYIRDDFFKADGGGIAQYVSYALNEQFTLNGRAEFWRDGRNFFVAGFQNNTDFLNSELGRPAPGIVSSPKAGSYGALTLGVTYKPAGLPAPVSNLLIRPEIRYDQSLNNAHSFNNGKDNGAFTFAADFVLGF
jgi:hypothetical protein